MCVLNVFMLSKSEEENKQVKLEEENNIRVESFTVKERKREKEGKSINNQSNPCNLERVEGRGRMDVGREGEKRKRGPHVSRSDLGGGG